MVQKPYPAVNNPLLNRKNATYKPFIDRAERTGVELFFTECSSVVESSHDAKPERDLAKVQRDLASDAWSDIIWCGKTPIECARDLGLLVPGGGVALAGVPLDVSVGNPILVFAQKVNAFLDFDGTSAKAYSKPEDVPSWWKSGAVGGEVNDV